MKPGIWFFQGTYILRINSELPFYQSSFQVHFKKKKKQQKHKPNWVVLTSSSTQKLSYLMLIWLWKFHIKLSRLVRNYVSNYFQKSPRYEANNASSRFILLQHTKKKLEKKMSNLAAQVSIKQNCKERELISLRSGFAAATPSSELGCFHLLLQWLHFRAVCEPWQSTPSASELLDLGFCLWNTGSTPIFHREHPIRWGGKYCS